MQRSPSRNSRLFLWLLGAWVALAAAAVPASAATISYGDFGPVPPGLSFLDVTESSGTDPVPLYGAPEVFATGLDFDPIGFLATGSAGSQDVTDGQLNLTLSSDPSVGITSINLFEAGDFSLEGVGTSATQALAGAIIRATVTQIDGLDVAPLSLTPVNASIGFDLASNSGVLQPWSLGLLLDVAAALSPGQRATRVEVVIDDQLLAFSELASVAFIAKKEFRLEIGSGTVPSTLLLLLLTGGGAAVWHRRRASRPAA